MNPFNLFNQWFKLEKETSTSDLVSACCMSTIGLDGYPNSRIVALKNYEGKEIPVPDHWSGFIIIPVRIEFFEFNEDRLHRRLLYTRENGVWQQQELQP